MSNEPELFTVCYNGTGETFPSFLLAHKRATELANEHPGYPFYIYSTVCYVKAPVSNTETVWVERKALTSMADAFANVRDQENYRKP